MTEKIQAIRGMNDLLPEKSVLWQHVEFNLRDCLKKYGYQEIRFPVMESTQLFKRTIGEVTDIVEKEMYTFQDLNGDSITLRPEGTAGCVRACLEHGLLYNQQQKLWYQGSMFRHERPQKGRYREFNQLGVETFGISGAAIEIELIALSRRFWQKLGISDAVKLQINTLGELSERQQYKALLIDYLNKHFDKLDPDSQKRLHKNPLRILDSKNPDLQEIIQNAPRLMEVLSEQSKRRFTALCEGLNALNIPFEINPFLVRGLDYYGHLVFEWITDKLGSQSAVCAGGRYDILVEQLGGNSTPAVGFALGIERLVLLMETLGLNQIKTKGQSVFIIATHDEAITQGLLIAETIRNELSALDVIMNTAGGGFKSQFKKADKSGARLALILGEEEINKRQVSIKDLRVESEQITIDLKQLNEFLQDYLGLI